MPDSGISNPESDGFGMPRGGTGAGMMLGVIGTSGYLTHAGYHVLSGHPEDALWVCHVAALLVAFGLIAGSSVLNTVGLLCATLGLPSWLLYLLSGEPLIPTSLLTHVLGPALGLVGVRRLGLARSGWWVALGFVGALTLVSRLITPEASNVNLAFGPIEGLSLWNVGGPAHLALWLGQWTIGLAAVQLVYGRIFRKVGWIS
jgi:hypothetical protein